jgi:hypothetical protein
MINCLLATKPRVWTENVNNCHRAIQLLFLDSLLFLAEHSLLSSSTLPPRTYIITIALLRFLRLSLSLLLFALSFAVSCIISVCLRRKIESIEMYWLRRFQIMNFKVYHIFWFCKSVYHLTFKWINQPDAAIFYVYYLSFKYSSTCFRHPHAHHQELSSSLRFTVGTWW